MVVVNEVYYDGYLKQNLDIAKNVIVKDWDMVFVVDGVEGSGKSVLAQQMAYYCDNTLTMDRICFTPDEFQDAVEKAKKYQAVIFDEAFTGLSSREAMSRVNKSLIKMLAEIRQKNLFVFIVMPSFFDIDKYVALHRSRALIHVYTGEKFERGFFSFYNMERKTSLYVNGKKFYNYFQPQPNFKGRFTNRHCVDEVKYREKKAKSLSKKRRIRDATIEKEEFEKRYIEHLGSKLAMIPPEKMSNEMKAELLGVTKRTITNHRSKYKEHLENGKKTEFSIGNGGSL